MKFYLYLSEAEYEFVKRQKKGFVRRLVQEAMTPAPRPSTNRLPTPCPQCGAALPPRTHRCERCGLRFARPVS